MANCLEPGETGTLKTFPQSLFDLYIIISSMGWVVGMLCPLITSVREERFRSVDSGPLKSDIKIKTTTASASSAT